MYPSVRAKPATGYYPHRSGSRRRKEQSGHGGSSSPNMTNFARQARITRFCLMQLHQTKPQAMLDVALPELVQQWPPASVMFQIFGGVFREQDVAGVAATHHALADIDSRP